MASLKESIKNIEQYFRGIDYFNDAVMVKCELPDKLSIVEDIDKGIKATKGDDGLIYYYGNKNEVEIEDIFALIETTIHVYEEAKEKAALFRIKCEELKALFANTDLKQLNSLYFAFSEPTTIEPTKPKKRKYNKKKLETIQETNVVEQTINENNETVNVETVDTVAINE